MIGDNPDLDKRVKEFMDGQQVSFSQDIGWHSSAELRRIDEEGERAIEKRPHDHELKLWIKRARHWYFTAANAQSELAATRAALTITQECLDLAKEDLRRREDEMAATRSALDIAEENLTSAGESEGELYAQREEEERRRESASP